MIGEAERQRRWRSEASFFNRIAAEVRPNALLIEPSVVARYRRAQRPWFNKEFRFRLLGDLQGRRVLDVGCGEGSNAMLLAMMGAQVTGVDVSPGCIEVARKRALRSGLQDRVELQCAPLETVLLPSHAFDVVWGDGVLHHLIPELPDVMARLVGWAKHDALFVFSEPVSQAEWLRKLRKNVPIHTDATPDERPLSEAELAVVRESLPDLKMRSFGLLGRLDRLFLARGGYEGASVFRRMGVSALCMADSALLSVPFVDCLGGMRVLWGHPPPRP